MKKIPQLSSFWVVATAGIGLAIRHGPHFFASCSQPGRRHTL